MDEDYYESTANIHSAAIEYDVAVNRLPFQNTDFDIVSGLDNFALQSLDFAADVASGCLEFAADIIPDVIAELFL